MNSNIHLSEDKSSISVTDTVAVGVSLLAVEVSDVTVLVSILMGLGDTGCVCGSSLMMVTVCCVVTGSV